MFHLSTTKFSRSVATLLEVLQLFQSDSHFRGIEAADVSLSHAGYPMCVMKFDGKLTVRMSGSMPDLFLAMLDEIDGAYFRPNGKRLEPWQIRRSHWQLLFFAFELSTRPLYLFTSEQVIAFANNGSASLFQLCEAEARARFGFGPGGPAVSFGSGHVNGRHEVHLAYALAAGASVPEVVLKDYAALAESFGNVIRWARTLLTVPELRGVMPVSKLRVLISVMTHSRQSISSANAAVLAMVARLLPNEPTHAEVDDLLCRHGLLDARALPETYFEPVDIGSPVSPFATVLRRVMADERKASTLERLEKKRAAREISQREYDLHRHLAALDHGRTTFEFANRMALAIQNADLHLLIDVLDRPDDANRWTKKAVREFYGVKLNGVTAKARRRAIFALAGLDEAQQLEWEQRAAANRKAEADARDAERAKERAQSARYRYGHKVITGAQHVEQSIASGFSMITSNRYGASLRYSLVAPAHDSAESRTLRASDGTLVMRSIFFRRANRLSTPRNPLDPTPGALRRVFLFFRSQHPTKAGMKTRRFGAFAAPSVPKLHSSTASSTHRPSAPRSTVGRLHLPHRDHVPLGVGFVGFSFSGKTTMQVTSSQLFELLSLYVPKRLPVLITGRPGIGKSDIVEQVAQATDHELLISHPVVEDPTDSKGLPFPSRDGQTAQFLPFGDLERALSARRPLIWFLDDLGQASPAVQAAKMQLLLARRIGEHVLPSNVTFLAATNRRTDNAGVTGILDPVISRFATVVELTPTIDDWTAWAVRSGIAPALIAFLRFRPDLLSVQKTSRDIENTPSPRSWGFVAKTMDVVPKALELISHAGSVGEGAASEFVAFLQIFRELPSPDAILLNPDRAPIPENAAALYATAAALAAYATEANFDRVMVYVDRMIAGGLREYSALLVRDALRRTPTIANSYAFINAQGGEVGKIIRGE